MAGTIQGLYSAGVSYAAPFSCSSFTTTSATVCSLAASLSAADTFFTNFNANTAAFAQLSTQYNLQCINFGAAQYDDSVSVATCQASAIMLVPCAQLVVPFPFCACINNSGITPFTFATAVTEAPYGMVAGKAATLYSFTLQIGTGYGSGMAQTVADKAEFYLDQSMRSKILGSVFLGVFQPPSWGSATLQPDSFKVQFGTAGIAASAAAGVQVGIIVDATTTLSALSVQFPTQLYYTIFSADLKYCPRGFVYPPTA